MKRIVLYALGCTLLAVPALAQSPSTQEFVNKVAQSDMLEIQSSQLIAPKADADTKPFAEMMIRDHTKTSNELKGLVQGGKVKADLPTALDAEHQKKLDDLKKLSGRELDKQYDQMQLQAHQEAVNLFTRYSQSGDNPELKQWAAQTLPHLKEHLSMAQKLDQARPNNAAIDTTGRSTTGGPVSGANSFSEGQAKSRIESNGYTNVSLLTKDSNGVWRGKAMKDGKSMDVSLDFQGNVFAQ
jgi:putative membrane protein